MPEINVTIPASLKAALDAEIAKTGASVSSIVTSSLARYFGTTVHTLFQVSTSGALVAGIYEGAVSAGVILRHGDFGLGTFENLDGEMVVLDGHVYRVRGTGKVSEAAQDALAPFAVVTRFAPLRCRPPLGSSPVLKKALDTPGPVIIGVHVDYRDNINLFKTVDDNAFH